MINSRPTLAQVARRAGVSVASVSRALNGGPASWETVERVREAVRELGYYPVATSRLLKLDHAPSLTYAVPVIANPVYVEMVGVMEAVSRDNGFRLSVTSCGADPKELTRMIRSLDRGSADGLIITPLRLTREITEALSNISVPVVVIGAVDPLAPLDSVAVDSAAGVRFAVDHLMERGYGTVTLLNGPADTTPGCVRLEGYRDSATQHGFTPDVITADDFTLRAAESALQAWLTENPWPPAILASNDLMASAVLRTAMMAGIMPGRDVGVIGMDDTQLTEITHPTLTSVSLGAMERATQAIELLISRVTKPGRSYERVMVEPSLVVRESTPIRKGTVA